MRAGRDVSGFSPLVMIVLVLVGVVSLAGMGLLSAYAPELRSGDDGREHALSRSAVGFAAAARLLERSGTVVVRSRGAPSPAADEGLLVLTPSVQNSTRSVTAFAHSGPILLVLPKWRAFPDPVRRGWVRIDGLHNAEAVLHLMPQRQQSGVRLNRGPGTGAAITLRRPSGAVFGTTAPITSLQTISGGPWRPVLVDQAGGMVLAHNGRGFYVLSDPDLLNTPGLKTLAGARTAAAMLALIRAPDTPVVFDLTLHGFERTLNPLRLMLEPPLLGATLCLIFALLLVGAQAAVRFGPAASSQRALALGKRALADNTAGLVRLARREHRMASPYAELIRQEVARAAGIPRDLEPNQTDAALDRLAASVGARSSYSELAERARAARSPADLIEVARDLNEWRLEMTRGHR